MSDDELGEVLGELLGIDTMGDDLDGDDLDGIDTVGALRRRMRRRRRMGIMPKPRWRRGQLAPGVQAPREGLEPLPLVPDLGGGVFTAALTSITFRARPQRPFRAERLLASVRRNGASAAPLAAVTTGIFIGTQLQQLQIGNYDLEFFTPTAFGVRLDMQPAEPGIDIGIGTALSGGALAGADTIAVNLLFLGRSIAA